MWSSKGVLISALLTLWTLEGYTQFKKHFYIEDSKDFKSVELNLKINEGSCVMKSTLQPGVFTLYSREDAEKYSHQYSKELIGNICKINLELENHKTEGLTQSISNSFLGSGYNSTNNYWKVFLSEDKVYNLKFDYGIGNAKLDLSGLSLEQLKINTGSADVNVGYFSESANKVIMDTFDVKVDFGNVSVKHLNSAKTKYVHANVGFGNLYLDMSDSLYISSVIKGKVGAGTLYVNLPDENIPVRLSLSNSWFCSVKVPKGFTKVNDTTYVSKGYETKSGPSMEFILDVSMGSLVFRKMAD